MPSKSDQEGEKKLSHYRIGNTSLKFYTYIRHLQTKGRNTDICVKLLCNTARDGDDFPINGPVRRKIKETYRKPQGTI